MDGASLAKYWGTRGPYSSPRIDAYMLLWLRRRLSSSVRLAAHWWSSFVDRPCKISLFSPISFILFSIQLRLRAPNNFAFCQRRLERQFSKMVGHMYTDYSRRPSSYKTFDKKLSCSRETALHVFLRTQSHQKSANCP